MVTIHRSTGHTLEVILMQHICAFYLCHFFYFILSKSKKACRMWWLQHQLQSHIQIVTPHLTIWVTVHQMFDLSVSQLPPVLNWGIVVTIYQGSLNWCPEYCEKSQRIQQNGDQPNEFHHQMPLPQHKPFHRAPQSRQGCDTLKISAVGKQNEQHLALITSLSHTGQQ